MLPLPCLSSGQDLTLRQPLEQVVATNMRIQANQLDCDIVDEYANAEWANFEPQPLLVLAHEAN